MARAPKKTAAPTQQPAAGADEVQPSTTERARALTMGKSKE